MTLNVECGFCGGGFEVDDIHAGRRVRCPTCKRIVRVPPQEEFRARAEQSQAGANAASSAHEFEEGRPAKSEPVPAPEPAKPESRPAKEGDGLALRRASRILVAIIVISVALAIWESFYAIGQAVAPAATSSLRDIVAGFRDWAHSFIPSLTHLRPGIIKPFGMLDKVIVAAILTILALRVMFRSALLGASYGDAPGEAESRRGVAGLLFHFLALMLLVAIVASAGTAVSQGRIFLGACLIASFLVLSALALATMRVASRLGGAVMIARAFNDGIFGTAAVILLWRGGIPNAPFGLIQQCAVLALANSVVGLAISGTTFGEPGNKATKGFGFSVLGVIILLIVVLLFSTAGQTP